MDSRPVLFLIDGHAVAYRSYFALSHSGRFVAPNGEPTSATYGFSGAILGIYEKYQPQYIAVTFDKGLSGREELFSGYKATRSKMPEDLAQQFDRINQIVDAFNIPRLTMDNMEADDILGTISRQAEEQGVQVHIVTGDKDILQLLSDNVRVQLPKRGSDDVVYDMDTFRERFDLEPNQLIDLKALMGDNSDNIPGVKGIGEKGATTLLKEFGTLDNIYDNLDDVNTRNRNKLIAEKDMAYISQNLATIMRDLPIELDLESCTAKDFELEPVDDIFVKLGSNTLRDRLKKVYKMLHGEDAVEDKTTYAHDVVETVVVRDEPTLEKMVKALNCAKLIAFDTETTSIDQMSAELVGISLAVDGETGYYIPVGHSVAKNGEQMEMFADPVGYQLPLETVIDALREPLTNSNISKTAHNAIYDYIVLKRYGLDVAPITFDTMLAEWVADPISRNLGLKSLVDDRFKISMTEISELLGKGKKQITMAAVDIDVAAPYAAADAVMTYKLVKPLDDTLRESELNKLYEEMEVPLIPVVASMQYRGVTLDVDFLADMSQDLDQQLSELEQAIYDAGGGGKFNINSPKQLNVVLFDTLKLPVEGLSKTTHGYSTNAVTLEILKNEHPIIDMIINNRELSKLKSTYVDALPELVNPKTGRVHTSYNQTGSATGRFSSSNPNLQNIPIRTELGREVRRAFVAPEGYVFLAVDYSQIELRVMAHISQDETLIDAFQRDLDIHQATAATVNGIDPDDVTYDQRSFAKRVNFGLMYGMGAFRLARDSDLTLAEAEDFIKTYFERMPGVEQYIEQTKAFVWEHGYTETLYGRRRVYPAIERGQRSRSTASEERAAINMPIQGTAADILKQSMLNLYTRLNQESYDAAMTLQVHDELLLEVKEDELDAVKTLVVETMESAFPDGKPLLVPLKANASYGKNWRDMEDMD
jgi:DNA polymerase I